jgi:micrococcal nuclease
MTLLKCTTAFFTLLLIVFSPQTAQSQSAVDPLFSHQEQHDTLAIIEEVISTDTFQLKSGERVHLIGLKAGPAPQQKKVKQDQYGFVIPDESPFQDPEEQALAFVKSLVEGKEVRLEFDSQKRGKYEILLAYVYLKDSDLLINEEILRHGYASLSLSPPNLKYSHRLRAAYQEARREQRGMHGE